MIGVAMGGIGIAAIKRRDLQKARKDAAKYLTLFRGINQYLVTKQMDKHIKTYFVENGMTKVALYGMSHIAQRIIDDLSGSEIQVVYGIDQRADRITSDVKIYKPTESLPETDVIVVTAYDFDIIAEALQDKVECPIISYEDIVFNL